MKRILLLLSLVFGVVAIGGGLYARLASDGPAPQVSYWGDGRMKASTGYVDGVKQGASEQWYPSGQLECRGEYRDGLREGAWTFWREDGSVDAERSGEYREGKRLAEAGD